MMTRGVHSTVLHTGTICPESSFLPRVPPQKKNGELIVSGSGNLILRLSVILETSADS